MIRVEHLTKRFGSTLAVDDLSFEVGRGEVVGFLGPNGAGKTTTIRVLAGYHPASSGRAVVAGHDVTGDSLAARRQIGYLAENVPIYPDLRVAEYLRYRAALKGVPRRERTAAVERAMQRADIVDRARWLCGKLSRGYRQRVGLADALVANPPILILDEPTSGLDPNQRVRVKEVVRELAADHTILFSSHILGEVQDVSSRILLIHRGRLRADGAPAQLTAKAGRTLHAVARCPTTVLAQVLAAAVPGQQPTVDAEGPVARGRVPLGDGHDPSAEVGARLLAAGAAVHELRVALPSLEEYFHLMTEHADRAAAAAGAEP
ncbi:MAG: ABC transporter ATP-binding protein [Planctomycetes bacterium]|nr:ABC transporter ATP-binding protein [Planctomycetota bacterium]